MTEKISKYTLWGLMGVSIVLLIAFFAIGFDTPYEDNPKFTEPTLLDPLMWWMIVLAVVTIGCTLWGLFNSLTTKGTGTMKETGLIAHTNSIAWGLCAASIALGAIMGFMSKDENMLINGKNFNEAGENAIDIIMTDISMVSIAILIIATFVATILSMLPTRK